MAVGDENVGPAVEIIVKKEAAEAQSEQRGAADFRARRFINEEPFSFIVIERNHLVREIGDEHAGVAGMIVVGGVHAHARAGHAVFAEGHTCDHGFFAERAVAIVAIELVGLRVVGEKKVRPAVVVVVEHGDAERFRRGVAEAGFLRHVFESAIAAIVP